MMLQPRRKKWSEAEERTLIDKYGEMVSDGTLAKMKTRKKKFEPIAVHVNSMHHVQEPVLYPWQWTWKDVSTKVQNMRNQYALVKQKIRKVGSVAAGGDDSAGVITEEYEWKEGLEHWSNFLRYKEVFGDVAIVFSGKDSMAVIGDGVGAGGGLDGSSQGIVQFGHLGHSGDGEFMAGIDSVENGVMALEFHYDGEEDEENYEDGGDSRGGRVKEDGEDGFASEGVEPVASDVRKRRKVFCEKRAWSFLAYQLKQLKEMEARFEQREADRERERQRKERVQTEAEQERLRKFEEREKEREERVKAWEILRRHRIQEWEKMEEENEERDRRKREEALAYEREWEERMNRRRSEWKKRMDEMLSQHRAEMTQMHTRILHEQQNLTNQLVGIISQWTGHPTALSDHTGASSHYFSQMMQNLQHVNGMVHGDARVEGDNQEDQFIVDGVG